MHSTLWEAVLVKNRITLICLGVQTLVVPYLMFFVTFCRSAVEYAVKSAQTRVDTAKELLENTQTRYDAASKSLKESNDELGQALADMAKFSMKKINFEKIRETLIKGIKALAKLREQWGKMLRFFQMISNVIKCSMSTSLEDFVESSKQGGSAHWLPGKCLSNWLSLSPRTYQTGCQTSDRCLPFLEAISFSFSYFYPSFLWFSSFICTLRSTLRRTGISTKKENCHSAS